MLSCRIKKIFKRYRSLTGGVTPEDISGFRKKYNISQRELVSILGWGKMTINRYERGALPSQSHGDILKAIILSKKAFIEKVADAYRLNRISKEIYDKLQENFQ